MLNTPDYTSADYRKDCEDRKTFEAILARISDVTGVSDEAGFAELFQVRISTYRQACRECRLEKGWVEQLCRQYDIAPEWLLKGEGEKYLAGGDHA